jgi:hypothetical protein
MRRIILETGHGGRIDILPHPTGARLFQEFVEALPESFEFRHATFSGEAVFFVHRLSASPSGDELTDTLHPGSLCYFPNLAEFILTYGRASPRDRRGPIRVATVGVASDGDGLRRLGERIRRHGSEVIRLLSDS